MEAINTEYIMPEDELIPTRTTGNTTNTINYSFKIINCPFCGANNIIEPDYQGQIFCWRCGKEIIR